MAIELAWSGSAAAVEDRLVEKCRSGDSSAFDELVSRYQLRLFRFAFRMLQDRSEAEDAVQETFVRTYRALPGYRPDGFFSSWIYRIVLNECRRRLRSKRPTAGLELAEATPSNIPGPQAVVMTGERNRQLRQAVDDLPEHYRMVMVLFYFEEMSVDQISRTLGASVSAVKVRLHRGRERLATRLDGIQTR